MTEREKIVCARCGKTLGEIEPQTWLIIESPEIDESIQESRSDEDYEFCCDQCYKAQIASDKSWEDADGEEPYVRNVYVNEEGGEEE